MAQKSEAEGTNTPQPNPKFERIEKYTVKPEFWDSVLDSIPPWGDEIAAIVLIVFGVVSFLSLLNISADATIAAAWSNALTNLFGFGSVIVCAGIFGLGIIILLPKIGVFVQFPMTRILALEIAFLSSLALLHLSVGDPELRAVARAGQGGGHIGWALTMPIQGLFGSITTLVVYVFLFVCSVGFVIGIQRTQLARWLTKAEKSTSSFAENVQRMPVRKRRKRPKKAVAPMDVALEKVGAAPPPSPSLSRSKTIVRIRPNPDNLPPSRRQAADDEEEAKQSRNRRSRSKSKSRTETQDDLPVAETKEIVDVKQLGSGKRIVLVGKEDSFSNTVGTVRGRKNKDGVQEVERPDGRIKRYFSVTDFKEPKRVGRRKSDLPSLDLMQDIEITLPDEEEINTNVVLIENTLLEFDIDIDVVDVRVGPTVTQYAVQPFKEETNLEGELTRKQRTRINKIASLGNDLSLSLSAKRLRMETPVPGESYIGIEVPNKEPSIVALRSVYESREYYDAMQDAKTPLIVPLGRDVAGDPVSMDIGTMPHVLIAGTTGSGKSVAIAAMATSLVLNNMPDEVKLIMLDPKMVELSRFNGLPHLLGPVETDQERIIGVLKWCTREMERRYKLLEEHRARNIATYNDRYTRREKEKRLPYICIMIDELADLMMSFPEETENSITRLAQMARAVGMHLVVATQRPSVDVVTGLIKANFPARISFAVASGVDSRVIIDTVGAEALMGSGDMLYMAPDAAAPVRIQGCFVSDDEVRQVVGHWKAWFKDQIEEGKMRRIYNGPWERALTRRQLLSETDDMLEDAIALVVEEGEASASMIQRKLNIGYPRAGRIMDMLEELGIIGETKSGGRTREVLIKPGQDAFKEIVDERTNN